MSDLHPRARVVIATDKFRGTALASDLADQLARVTRELGGDAHDVALCDGGEGFVDALCERVLEFEVPDDDGTGVATRIGLCEDSTGLVAVVESADVIGHPAVPRSSAAALAASSAPLGHVIVRAMSLDVTAVVVGCGGTGVSDGGWGCYQVLRDRRGPSRPLRVATDVTATFLEARDFAAQKGVDPIDLGLVDERLGHLRALYRRDGGRDLATVARSGAGGGVAGALAALGATLESGFEIVARHHQLDRYLRDAAVVVTGEGRLDAGSWRGKVVGALAERCDPATPLIVICGEVADGADDDLRSRHPLARVESLTARFGRARATNDTLSCVSELARELLAPYVTVGA